MNKPMNFKLWLYINHKLDENELNEEDENNYGDEWGDYLYSKGYESTSDGLKLIIDLLK
jgi:hypothetical protein